MTVPDLEHGFQLRPLTVTIRPGQVEMVGLRPKVGRVAIVTGTWERSVSDLESAGTTVAEVRATKVTVMPGQMD